MNDINGSSDLNENKSADNANNLQAAMNPQQAPPAQPSQPAQNDYSQYSYNYDPTAAPAAYKKPMPAWVIPTIVIAAILIAAAAVCMIIPSVRNSLKLAFSSPEKYYAEAERKSVSDLSDSVYAVFSSMKEDQNEQSIRNISEKTTMKFTFGDPVTDALGDYKDILKNVSLSGDFTVKGDNSHIYLDLLLNDTSIISADVFADTAANTGYLSFPELSDKYYKSELNSSDTVKSSSENDVSLFDCDSITQERLDSISQRYIGIYLDAVSDKIVMDKKSTCTLGNVSCPAVKVTISLTEAEYLELVRSVTDALKSDEDIIAIAEDMGSRREDYIAQIDEFVSDMNLTASDENMFDITIYIGTDGNIIGRTFTKSDSVISFVNISDDDSFASETKLIFSDKTGMELMIKGSIGGTTLNGTADLTIYENDDDDTVKSYSARMQFEDVKYDILESRTYGGKFTFTSPDLDKLEIVMTVDGNENTSTVSADISYEGKKYLSVLTDTQKQEAAEEIVFPSDDVCTEEPTEVLGDDMTAVLTENISKATGLSEDELMQALYSIILGDDYDPEAFEDFDNDYSYDDFDFDDYYDDYYDDEDDYDYDYGDYDYDEDDFADYDPGVSSYEYKSVDLSGVSFTANGDDITIPCKALSLPDRIVRTSSALEPHTGGYFYNDSNTIMIYIENEKNSAFSADVSQCKSIRVIEGGESELDLRANGIGIGSSADSIVSALGEPSDSMIYSEGTADYIYCDYESDLYIIISAYNNEVCSINASTSYLY